jgi:two-component system phosphate regulon sensor histidine kinase PhoR
VEQDEKEIRFRVCDNGLGISKVEQAKIFDKFYRVESGNVHNIKGFGLGLSYVKKIIDIYKGKIEVKSKLKQGSTFTVSLPKPDFTQQIN